MGMSSELSIDVPPAEWMSANDRLHWAEKARRTKALRQRAYYRGRDVNIAFIKRVGKRPRLPLYQCPVRVTVTIHASRRGRMDPANSYPTIKALIDGLTDAGLWADDDAEHLIGPDMRLGEPDPSMRKGWRRIVITIEAAEEEK